MKKIIFIALGLTLILSSCRYYTFAFQSGSTSFTETSPDSIEIYSGGIDQDHIVIGSVAVDVPGGTLAAVNYLKLEASKLGADAIIHVELKQQGTYINRVGISGVAIKRTE